MSDAAAIAAGLKAGGVAVLPTDTVYGLAAAPDHPQAVARIFALKRRPHTRNLPVMAADADQIADLGVTISPAAARLLASAFVPGALTIAFAVDAARAPAWLAGRTEVAVRIPDHAFMRAVLRATGPLLVTSANAHGLATPESLADVLAQLDGAPDFAFDGGVLSNTPSTLVNCAVDPPVIEREGAIPAAAIGAVLT
ncbi:MAG: L-threonylcarbamoyladenylate synthase [Hyphomonadaceae bacterium]|nr:L-threonylcarbamoyladenylate synthase [Hyphomonadaceae bacterium]